MQNLNETDYNVAQTENIVVSAYPELLDSDDKRYELWAYCLRIENNSAERIRLLQKDFCITDSLGHTQYILGSGFNGELPDVEANEYFEYEDTAVISGRAAVLYGHCLAQKADGTMFKIALPIMQLSTPNPRKNRFATH
ncbi:MAG: ApaG domain [Alphaproteobacteria bacterium]|nr:ApaG domain [Alphaproteobacteria bacterium]